MKTLINTLIVVFCFCGSLIAAPLTLDEVSEAGCRVTNFSAMGSPQSLGSGTVVKETGSTYYVLTNGHVVENGATFSVEFFKDGYVSRRVPAVLAWKNYVLGSSIDLAIIAINKRDLGGYSPRVIKLAPQNYTIDKNTLIRGSGCPNGYWLQCWNSRVISNNGTTIHFNQPPVGGQSGSGILADINTDSGKETRLVGIVTWRMPSTNGQFGGGISNSRINEILLRKAKPDQVAVNWHFALCSQKITEDTECDCGHKAGEHIIIYNNITKKPRLNSLGDVHLHCPNKSLLLKNGDVIIYARDCPNGWCPWTKPQPKPEQPQNDPPNIFGEDGGGSDDDEEDNTIDRLLKENSELKKSLDSAATYINGLEKENDNLKKSNEELATKVKSITEAKDSVEAEKSQIVEKKKEVDEAFAAIAIEKGKLEEEKQTLVSENKTLGDQIKDLLADKDKLLLLINEKKELFNRVFSDDGATWFERLIMLLCGGTLGATIWNKYVYPKLLERGKIPAWLAKIVVKRYAKKIRAKLNIPQEQKVVYDIEEEDEDEDDDVLAESLIEQPLAVKKKLEVEHNVSGQVDHVLIIPEKIRRGIEEHFNALEKSGEPCSRQMWALKAKLYKEGIDKLRKGQLTTKDGTPVLRAQDAADLIENWVLDRMFTMVQNKDLTVDILAKNDLLTQAYLGVLYAEAMESLKSGKMDLQTVNNVVIADSLDNYVKSRYVKKVFPSYDRSGK